MSREVRRVPLDFDWPLNEVWSGYLRPDSLDGIACGACAGTGYSPRAKELHDLWYGHRPFRPEDNGSTTLTPDTPAVRAFAERNVQNAPDFYLRFHHAEPFGLDAFGGAGDDLSPEERATRREAARLADRWNGQWCHHLNADDVAALVAGDRLWDLTHTFDRVNRWQPKDPFVVPTPEQVNTWSLSGFGHDSINSWIVVRARCAREGVPDECGTCGGHGSTEAYPGQRADAESWAATEPPAGEGWQLWETTSQGSPITPVFATPAELVDHLATVGDRHGSPMSRAAAAALVESGWAPSIVSAPASVAVGEETVTVPMVYTGGDALLALEGDERARSHRPGIGGSGG